MKHVQCELTSCLLGIDSFLKKKSKDLEHIVIEATTWPYWQLNATTTFNQMVVFWLLFVKGRRKFNFKVEPHDIIFMDEQLSYL